MTQPILTIPSRALEVWRRLYSRYNLEPFPASVGPDVSKTIIPVTNADDLLWAPEVRNDLVEVGATTVVVATVPAGERWTWFASEGGLAAGDRNVDRLLIGDVAASMILSSFSAASSFQYPLPQGLTMLEGWRILVRGIGGTTDGNWNFFNYIRKEQLF